MDHTGQAMRVRIQVGDSGVNPPAALRRPMPLTVQVNAPVGVELVEVRRDGEPIHVFNPRGAQRLSPRLLRVCWRGRPDDCWDGYLELLDNQVASAAPYAMAEGSGSLHPLGPRRLAWNSRPTTEDPQGLVLRLDRPLTGQLMVHVRGQEFRLNLGSFRGRAQRFTVATDGVLEICRLPDLPSPRDLQVTWLDAEATPGAHTYDALAILADGARHQTAPLTVQVEA